MEEAGPAVVAGAVRTAEEGGSHADAVVPAERMQPDVARVERVVQVVAPLRALVHVAAEDLAERSGAVFEEHGPCKDAHRSRASAESTQEAKRKYPRQNIGQQWAEKASVKRPGGRQRSRPHNGRPESV